MAGRSQNELALSWGQSQDLCKYTAGADGGIEPGGPAMARRTPLTLGDMARMPAC